jgi:hypothetical protein
MRKKATPREFGPILAELREGSDRATILVGASLLENMLERCISHRLRKPEVKVDEELLFSPNGLFDTFSTKIAAAYFLKIIRLPIRKQFDLVRSIRNEAAHDMNPVSFSNPAIGDRCRAIAPHSRAQPREIFVAFVEVTILNLVNRANSPAAEIEDIAVVVPNGALDVD